MTTITEDYVSFETAKLLKEKGFNEPTIGIYHKDGTFKHLCLNEWNSKFITPISAPTLQMTMKWLREVHNVDICAFPYQADYILYSYNVKIYKDKILTDYERTIN